MRAYERLLNYVVIHTTSDEASSTVPSTKRQFDLANKLKDEMISLGIEDASVDSNCYALEREATPFTVPLNILQQRVWISRPLFSVRS